MFSVNEFVHWEDPDRGLSSGIYKIISIHPEDEEQCEDTIFTLKNAMGSIAEVPPHEITKVTGVNLKVEYLYRDANNYKQGGSAILNGVPENLSDLDTSGSYDFKIAGKWGLKDGDGFIPGIVGFSDLQERFSADCPEDDHPWHTFEGWVFTTEPEDAGMTWEEFDQKMTNQDWGDLKLEMYEW